MDFVKKKKEVSKTVLKIWNLKADSHFSLLCNRINFLNYDFQRIKCAKLRKYINAIYYW